MERVFQALGLALDCLAPDCREQLGHRARLGRTGHTGNAADPATDGTKKESPSLADKNETTQAMHLKAKKRNIILAGLDNYQKAARKMGEMSSYKPKLVGHQWLTFSRVI